MDALLPSALFLTLVLSACGGERDGGVIQVYAASSLSAAFAEMEEAFERRHEDIDVRIAFAGSQILRLQIEEGAPADVFASADERQMAALEHGRPDVQGRVFAHNRLVLIVPRDNPAGIVSFEDLPSSARIVVGSPESPIGAYTEELLRRASRVYDEDFADRTQASVVSEESNVRLVRAKVELGEADAAIVYASDADSDAVRTIAAPPALAVAARYTIAAVSDVTEAATFVDFVASPRGQSILRAHGFEGAEAP